MNKSEQQSPVSSHETSSSGKERGNFIVGFRGVRYQVKDVGRSIAFYTEDLGFKLDQKNLPAFAQVSIANLKLILSGPGASGSRPNARWRHSGARRMEQDHSSSGRSISTG